MLFTRLAKLTIQPRTSTHDCALTLSVLTQEGTQQIAPRYLCFPPLFNNITITHFEEREESGEIMGDL